MSCYPEYRQGCDAAVGARPQRNGSPSRAISLKREMAEWSELMKCCCEAVLNVLICLNRNAAARYSACKTWKRVPESFASLSGHQKKKKKRLCKGNDWAGNEFGLH